MKKRKFCEGAIAFAASFGTALLMSLSFWSVTWIAPEWSASDYWRAWFAAFSFLAGIAGFFVSIVAIAGFLDGLCEG